MSYENAEPKVLKTLNSSGQVLDDHGNVINDSSDYWVQLYNQTEPKVDKILKSDGIIVDSEGNLIQDTTEFNTQKYNQAEPIPAKYLHSDGTINENPGVNANLEDNKTATIDVSTYTAPVEIEPSDDYDGMKKATVTLSNIPQPSGEILYIWSFEEGSSSVILPVGTFNEITIGMKGIGCGADSEYMYAGEIKRITDLGEIIFEDESGNYNIALTNSTSVTEFPNLED